MGNGFYPTDKDKLKKTPQKDLDPDKQGYLNALISELDSLRTMNVYNSPDNLDIVNVPEYKISNYIISRFIFNAA